MALISNKYSFSNNKVLPGISLPDINAILYAKSSFLSHLMHIMTSIVYSKSCKYVCGGSIDTVYDSFVVRGRHMFLTVGIYSP